MTVEGSDLPPLLTYLGSQRGRLRRFMLAYEAGIDEITTKLHILRREFSEAHAYNPIEEISSRLKSLESLLAKAQRRGCEASLDSIRRRITDIAGVRVVCSFVSDVYRVQELLCAQDDVKVLTVKDYVAAPKPNGYRSLHTIVEIPVFLSTGAQPVTVEVQFRTIAMDFWASLEHKIYYKYDAHVPPHLVDALRATATTAARLDADMEALQREIRGDVLSTTVGTRRPDNLSDETVAEFLRFLATASDADAT